MSRPEGRVNDQPAIDRRRHFVLAVLCLAAVVNMIDRHIITIVLDPIKAEFGASDTAMWLLTGMIFAVFYAGASIPLARWADKGERRLVMAACLGFWSLMTTLGGLAQSFIQLAVTRVGVAVGEAGAGPTSQSMLSDLYPLSPRATVLAILSACSSIGIGLGVLLGGWLSDTFDWRVAFFIVGVPGLLLAIVIFRFLPEPQRGGSDGLVDDKVSPRFKDVLLHLGNGRGRLPQTSRSLGGSRSSESRDGCLEVLARQQAPLSGPQRRELVFQASVQRAPQCRLCPRDCTRRLICELARDRLDLREEIRRLDYPIDETDALGAISVDAVSQ